MGTTETLLFSILLMLFGGFIWLKEQQPFTSDVGYWVLLLAFVTGLLAMVYEWGHSGRA